MHTAWTVRKAPPADNGAPPSRRCLQFEPCLLQTRRGGAQECLTPMQGSVSQLWCQMAGHMAAKTGIFFLKGRKVLNGPFSLSVLIIVVSKLTRGRACWLAEYRECHSPSLTWSGSLTRGNQTPWKSDPGGEREGAGRAVGKRRK